MSAEIISAEQADRLLELEAIIQRGITTFIEVGSALTEIRDAKLYKKTHGTFEEYCLLKWKFSRFTAYNLMNAAEVVANVSNVDARQQKPTSEFQVRPLARLPAAQQPAAWQAAIEKAGGEQPTAKQVAVAVAEVKEVAEPKRERAFCPSNGMQYAALAIENLKKIQLNDTERDKAFMAVQRFLTQNYQAK